LEEIIVNLGLQRKVYQSVNDISADLKGAKFVTVFFARRDSVHP